MVAEPAIIIPREVMLILQIQVTAQVGLRGMASTSQEQEEMEGWEVKQAVEVGYLKMVAPTILLTSEVDLLPTVASVGSARVGPWVKAVLVVVVVV